MKSPSQREKELPESENTLPLINIVFLMLIFFMITGRIIPSEEIDVTVPSSRQTGDIPEDRSTITLAPDGGIYLGTSQIDMETLKSYLDNVAEEDSEITVRADGSVSGQAAVAVLQMVRKSGHKKLRLLTREER